MEFTPDIFLIGAMKAGTTSLAALLSQHPDICLASPKEPHYFTANQDKPMAWYTDCFANSNNKLCIDASTSYSIAPVPGPFKYKKEVQNYCGVPSRIKALNPSAKIIYMLREPVSRTYSHYIHNRRAGWEKRPFLKAISEDSQYLSASNYVAQLNLYREYFARENILLLSFDVFKADPESVARACIDFMQLPSTPSFELGHVKNAGFLYNNAGALVQNLGIMKPLARLLPPAIKSLLAPLVSTKPPPIPPKEKEFLSNYFSPLNQLLADTTGLDLSAWHMPRHRTPTNIIT